MDPREALALAERCAPQFAAAGLPAVQRIRGAAPKRIASLWAGMGSVYAIELDAEPAPVCIVAKCIALPRK